MFTRNNFVRVNYTNITSGKNNRMEYEEEFQEKLTEGLVLARTRAVDLDGVTKLNFWYVFMKG